MTNILLKRNKKYDIIIIENEKDDTMKYARGGMTSLDYLIEIQRLEADVAKLTVENEKLLNKIAKIQFELDDVVSEWISVNDRLPDEDGKYLVCGKLALSDIYGEPIQVVRFTERKEWLTSLSVKYWMPLPQKPESEDDAE